MEKVVKQAKQTALTWLADEGIRDTITVKVKRFPPSESDWIAKYRALSQFKSNVIVWVNKDLYNIMDSYNIPHHMAHEVIVDSIIHEYGHVIYEYFNFRKTDMIEYILEHWEDEEGWAEGFAMQMKDNAFSNETLYVLEEYKKEFS